MNIYSVAEERQGKSGLQQSEIDFFKNEMQGGVKVWYFGNYEARRLRNIFKNHK